MLPRAQTSLEPESYSGGKGDHKYVMRTMELLGNKVAPLVDKALA